MRVCRSLTRQVSSLLSSRNTMTKQSQTETENKSSLRSSMAALTGEIRFREERREREGIFPFQAKSDRKLTEVSEYFQPVGTFRDRRAALKPPSLSESGCRLQSRGGFQVSLSLNVRVRPLENDGDSSCSVNGLS